MYKYFILIGAIALLSCNNPIKDNNADKENNNKVITPKENTVYDLPEELSEISGITFLNDSVVVAIQDEDGILFYYNINQNSIIKKQAFGKKDDYEDLVKAGKDMYTITSKGLIHEIKDFESSKPVIRSFKTPFSKENDIEGLAYDAKNHRLLIAPKEAGLDMDKTTKEIYAFDLKTMTLQTTPVYTIHLPEIEAQFEGDALEESSKKFLKALGNQNMNKVFRSSAITINETTGETFILSVINGLIIVLTPEGILKKLIKLSGPEYKQPEGIAFSPNGKLYISNEGNKSGIGNIIELKHEN
ncbi:MAG: SdiA-regulated domain-containing protein [Daejeonella sp.]|uniref:SdiA-regulated domain-containing protein n=1 Tax=Daejeonella sp. TaxID=2805397 RepID=UPI00273608E5|nr:SdiA-regulated domain-containing protein [Daejeonella sp.]MDP3468499.1 SdiA-regulated domain-containing protein [Daejeonella sp.]